MNSRRPGGYLASGKASVASRPMDANRAISRAVSARSKTATIHASPSLRKAPSTLADRPDNERDCLSRAFDVERGVVQPRAGHEQERAEVGIGFLADAHRLPERPAAEQREVIYTANSATRRAARAAMRSNSAVPRSEARNGQCTAM